MDAAHSPLGRRLPPTRDASPDDLLDRFLDYCAEAGLTLYPAQEEAMLELAAGKNVILNTPTGSGKSLVALAMHFFALARGERSFATFPIKALASEKFFALCQAFGPENVGMMTGDATVNRSAPVVCCTAEILANIALREGREAAVDSVVMDEFHYYADRDRGVAWQVPLLTLPQARFLLMSATLGDTSFFEGELTRLTGAETALVRSTDRPVPLDFSYRDTPLHETVMDLVKVGQVPIYIVSFTQRGCAEEAQNLMSLDFCTKEEKRAIAAALEGTRFSSPYGKEVQRFLRHGIGLHHAGLLPKYRLLVEKLAQKGLLKIICGTDTLGVGVNIPIRTVLFTKLCKFDGEKTIILPVRDFHQISGRAGRKGFDDQGSVVVQAPEHVIENLRMEQRAGGDKAKLRKMVKKKPPERGYVPWDKATFERLVASPPEPLKSRFAVSHGMILNVLEGPSGCLGIARLIKRSHDDPRAKKAHGKLALQMVKSLLEAGILERVPVNGGHRLALHEEMGEDFSLHHALGLYLVETAPLLDMESETYALDLLSLVESILENPELILQKQVDRLKTIKLGELKAAGVEYEERMAELEKIEHPKPNRDFSYDTFNEFARRHPWVSHENIRPKAVAREMVESFYSFAEYIQEYELARAEGLLLRYLSDVYRTLVQTVPETAKTVEVDEIVEYLGAMLRKVDSSLLDEWERMRDPLRALEARERGEEVHAEAPPSFTRDEKRFTVLVRNAIFEVVRALARRDYEEAADLLAEDDDTWTAATLEATLAPFYDDHGAIRTDPAARSPSLMRIDRGRPGAWRVEQVLADPDEHNDWKLDCSVDLEASQEKQRPVLMLRYIGP